MKSLIIPLVLLVLYGSSWSQYALQRVNGKDSVIPMPVEMATPDDGSARFFIAQLTGKILLYRDITHLDSRKVFLDISDRVFPGANSGLGLLGFAFHPHLKDNGYIYVNYIGFVNNVVSTIISRFTISPTNPDSALRESEKILMTVPQPGWAHKGGSIEFGPDGYLYIPLGDGSDGRDPDNNAQNLKLLLGKILRIDVDLEILNAPPYVIPSDNPFFDDTTGIRKEIYAYGFRNPFQSSFDPYSGALWVGDVGQERFEEIDTIVKGGNYGWRIMEGFHRFADSTLDTGKLIQPIWEYDHWGENTGLCVVGGFVYHGLLFPKLRNKYIYADYASGRIWALTFDNGEISNEVVVDHDSTLPLNISCLFTDRIGNIYAAAISDGRIYKILSTAGVDDVAEKSSQTMRLDRTVTDDSHPSSTLYFDLSQTQRVTLSIYDAQGREIKQYFSRVFDPGENLYQFDTRTLKSGMYFLKMQTEKGIVMQKFVVL